MKARREQSKAETGSTKQFRGGSTGRSFIDDTAKTLEDLWNIQTTLDKIKIDPSNAE